MKNFAILSLVVASLGLSACDVKVEVESETPTEPVVEVEQVEEVEQIEEIVEEEESSLVYFAQQLDSEYPQDKTQLPHAVVKVFSFDTDTEESKEIDRFEDANGYNVTIRYANDAVYYINNKHQLVELDLISDSRNIIPIPDLETGGRFQTENTIGHFNVDGSSVTYLKGVCSEGLSCGIYTYDLETKENKEVSANITSEMEASIMAVVRIMDIEDDIAHLFQVGGDAGVSWIDTYDLNLTTGELTHLDKGSTQYCQQDPDAAWTCTEEQIEENEHFKGLTEKDFLECNETAIKERVLELQANDPERVKYQLQAIGC